MKRLIMVIVLSVLTAACAGRKGRAWVFDHEVIDPDPAGEENDVCLPGDLDGDGDPDIVIGGKVGEGNLVWYENPGWRRRTIGTAVLEAGGVIFDVDRDGRPDVVAGQPSTGDELYWFRNPGPAVAPWRRYLIQSGWIKYHDQAIGDLDGDGRDELVFLSQGEEKLAYFRVPDDPLIDGWPLENRRIVADVNTEGLVVIDLDGDGDNDIAAGANWYENMGMGESFRHHRVTDLLERRTRVRIADLDGDGRLDFILCEAEITEGRLGWCRAPDWQFELLAEGLDNPHSLEIADADRDGDPDIFVGEMNLNGGNPDALLAWFENLGGTFRKREISRGIGTHDAKVADLDGDGDPDIVGKPYRPAGSVDIWINRLRSK